MAGTSPQTCDAGMAISPNTERSHIPLLSPCAADSQVSIVCGADSGAAAEVASMSPKKVASFTLPRLIANGPHRSGRLRDTDRMVAVRSPVRERQDVSAAQSWL